MTDVVPSLASRVTATEPNSRNLMDANPEHPSHAEREKAIANPFGRLRRNKTPPLVRGTCEITCSSEYFTHAPVGPIAHGGSTT